MRSHSFNHYAYGSVVEWMYRDMCGLNPTVNVNESAGFRHAKIAPKPHPSIQSVSTKYRSSAGYYEISWQIDDTKQVNLEISIPFNASASVVLSDVAVADVVLNGLLVTDAEQIDSDLSFTLIAGQYSIQYPLHQH